MPGHDQSRNDHSTVIALTFGDAETAQRRLPSCIKKDAAELVEAWQAFARTLMPSEDGKTLPPESQVVLRQKVVECTDRMHALVSELLDVTRARFGPELPVVRTTLNVGIVAE
jgi:hypothetical protein